MHKLTRNIVANAIDVKCYWWCTARRLCYRRYRLQQVSYKYSSKIYRDPGGGSEFGHFAFS